MQCLAVLTGYKLVEFPLNSETDALELLGGYEQVSEGDAILSDCQEMTKDFLVFLLNRSILNVAIAISWARLLMFRDA